MCSLVYQSYINKGTISAEFYEYTIYIIFATVMTSFNLSASLLKQTWLSVNILLDIEILILILTGDKYGIYTLYILLLEHERRIWNGHCLLIFSMIPYYLLPIVVVVAINLFFFYYYFLGCSKESGNADM